MAINVEKLVDWDEMGDEAANVMKPYHAQLMELACADAADLLGDSAGIDTNSSPRIKQVLEELAHRTKEIAERTKEGIKGLVFEGLQQGWERERLVQEIKDYGEQMSKSRALEIARTVGGTAYNLGALLSYEQAGVTEVDVLDADDAEECAEVDGEVWTVEDAVAAPLGSSTCTRTFVPRMN